MKNNFKFLIYVFILIFFASVVWIKYDHDHGVKNNDKEEVDTFLEFVNDNAIEQISFSCPAKNEIIIYLDNEYLLTSLGELYEVKYDSLFENGYNCKKIELGVNFKGFYSDNTIIYDEEYNFYDIKNNLNDYDNELIEYYVEDLNNLGIINSKYPYIYFYDVEAKSLNLDNTSSSNKLLIDNKGNVNVYTNYGYPSALNLLTSEDTEIIFDRLSYRGVILSIFRSNNNDLLDTEKVEYLSLSMEVPKEVYGLRIITTKGLYNEVMDDDCSQEFCKTKLELDKEFSKHFDDIVYSNGKYIFIKDTPTIIYNIEKYIEAK